MKKKIPKLKMRDVCVVVFLISLILGIHGCTVTTPHIPTVIHVPDGYPTIQEALDAALEGDTVLVAAGIYPENIVWSNTQSVVLVSEDGPDSTIVDGGKTGHVI